MQNNIIKKPLVIDTNLLISAMISPNSIIHEVLEKALENYVIYNSQQTIDEFLEVAKREKFLRFFKDLSKRDSFIDFVIKSTKIIEPTHTVTDCRDPKDNKFLEIALTCQAVYLVSGDKDLLTLNPYQNIKIVTANEFLEIEN